MASEYDRRRFLEWARTYAEKYGYDPKTIDAEAWYDSTLNAQENKEIIKNAYPPVKSTDQVAEDEGNRNMGQYAKYANVEGSRRRAEEVKAARKPGVFDKIGAWKEKNIDEPAKRRETERYFKTQDKIRERQESLKVKQLEQQERTLARQERELDKEAFNTSTTGRVLAGARQIGGVVKHFGAGTGGNQLIDSKNMREMLAPKMNSAGNNSPVYAGGKSNSVILGLLTGKSQESKHPHGHYVTVIEHGIAKRVYTGQPQPGQAPPTISEPSLMDRLIASNPNPPLLSQSPGKPTFDYSVSGNSLRDRMVMGKAKFGYTFNKPSKKMRYL